MASSSSTSKIQSVFLNVSCTSHLNTVHSKGVSADPDVVALYGHISSDKLTVLGCTRCSTPDQVIQLQQKLPGGVQICGISYLANKDEKFDSEPSNSILSEITEHEPVVVCCHRDGQDLTVSRVCTMLPDGVVTDVTFHISKEKFLQGCLIARATCYIPFSFTLPPKGSWQSSAHSTIESLCSEVSSPSTTFHLLASSVLLSDGWSSGVPDTATCADLASHIDSGEMGTRRRKADKTQKTLVFDVYTDLSGAGTLERTPPCAPVINYNTEKVRVVSVQLPMDVVTVVDLETPACDLAALLCGAICRQLAAMERCIVQFSKGEKFVTPRPYHFNPIDTDMLYTLVYPHGFSDMQLESHRREVHQSLCLGEDRPLFRLANKHQFPEDLESSGYLINVHESVPPSKVRGGQQYLVSGRYSYHHYMQDRFNDDKWGCAYRSLQTLVSWFRLQGYTDKPIPDHRTIQQTLVDIGDKEPSFVGSKKWIGSMEVSFVLDTILGVTSKILSVSAGSELAAKGRELAAHFTSQGTPVMIGGGVLAHTILGVDYDEVTGDISFLILDPHYTGAEDLKTITDKGWCGWKGPEFWDQHAHYNMCLPQRPAVI